LKKKEECRLGKGGGPVWGGRGWDKRGKEQGPLRKIVSRRNKDHFFYTFGDQLGGLSRLK